LSLFAPEHPGDARCLERFTEREYMFGHREFAPLLLWEAQGFSDLLVVFFSSKTGLLLFPRKIPSFC